MADLTKQDIDLLTTTLHAWSNQGPTMQEVEKIAGEVLGEKICTCPVCTAKAAGTGLDSRIELHRQQIEARICEMLNSRRERAAVVIAKLVGMRDSIVADQFFASIGDQPLWNLRSEI